VLEEVIVVVRDAVVGDDGHHARGLHEATSDTRRSSALE
jgi:hypothetical protein